MNTVAAAKKFARAPLTNADDIHYNGFFVGNHSKNNFAEIDYFVDVLNRTVSEV